MEGYTRKEEERRGRKEDRREDLGNRRSNSSALLDLSRQLPPDTLNNLDETIESEWSFKVRPNSNRDAIRPNDPIPEQRLNQAQARSTTTPDMDQLGRQLAESFAHTLTNVMGNRTPTHRSLPVFSGYDYEDPNTFILKLREYFRRNGIEKESDKVSIAADQLKEEASRWYEPYKPLPLTFKNFQDRLLSQFNSTSVLAMVRSKLYGDKQRENEQVTLFITRKRGLFTRLDPDISERIMTETILEQLRPEIRSRIRTNPCEDIERLIRISSQIENDLEKIAVANAKKQRSAHYVDNKENERPTNKQDRSENYTYSNTANICRRCPDDRHLFKDCPKNRRSGNEWRASGPPETPPTTRQAQ